MNMSRFSLLFVLAAALLFETCPVAAERQRFELENGNSVKGKLIGIYAGIVFVDTGSKGTSHFPFNWLKENSRESVENWFANYVASIDVESPKVNEVDTKFSKFLSESLVRPEDGKLESFDFGNERQPEFYLFYYSAHWCGPCRRFTPKLVAFYNVMKRMGHDFEIVFVSSDRSSKKMLAYMEEANMPWPAVAYPSKQNSTVRRYGGSGIPCLVVTDRNGAMLFHTYSGDEYLGPSDPLDKFERLLFSLGSLKKRVRELREQSE